MLWCLTPQNPTGAQSRGLAGIGVGRCDGPATADRELDRSDLLRARGLFYDSY